MTRPPPVDDGAGEAAGHGTELPRPITVAVANHNGREVLPDTLAALDAVRDDRTEVLMVDDGSDDGSPEWVEEHHPHVRVIRMGRNTARLNVVRNAALEAASCRYVFLTDNDVSVEPGCLATLLEVVLREPDVLCCTPRLVYHDEPGRIYHDGGELHFLCVSTAVPRGLRVAEHPPGPPAPTVGGGIMLIDREASREIGGFDAGYLLGWGDDGEFHVRGRLAGYRVLQVSSAAARHVERPRRTDRALGQLYNRYRLLLTAYSLRSLLLLAPALVLFEVALTAASLAGGFFGERMTALLRALGDLQDLLGRRREVQGRRRVEDREVLSGGPLMVPSGLEGTGWARVGARATAAVTNLYWRGVRRWL
ncbi:MAG: glycosyltransferase [Gemmatimonadota bacterium]